MIMTSVDPFLLIIVAMQALMCRPGSLHNGPDNVSVVVTPNRANSVHGVDRITNARISFGQLFVPFGKSTSKLVNSSPPLLLVVLDAVVMLLLSVIFPLPSTDPIKN
jgi:hypothetical protein